MRFRTFVAAVYLCCPTSVMGQAQWCDYHLGTLRGALDTAYTHLASARDSIGEARPWRLSKQYVKAYVITTGHRRPLPAPTAWLFDVIAKDSLWRRSFQQEFQILEAGDSTWVVASDALLATLARETRAGDTIWMFTSILGLHSTTSGYWVLAMDEFATSHDLAEWGQILRACHRP